MGSFDITGGRGGFSIRCRHCDADLDRDVETGNYFCPTSSCGKGSLSSPSGITTTVDEHGNVTFKNGKPT